MRLKLSWTVSARYCLQPNVYSARVNVGNVCYTTLCIKILWTIMSSVVNYFCMKIQDMKDLTSYIILHFARTGTYRTKPRLLWIRGLFILLYLPILFHRSWFGGERVGHSHLETLMGVSGTKHLRKPGKYKQLVFDLKKITTSFNQCSLSDKIIIWN